MYYVTGFKPFMGRSKNGSETLVRALSECNTFSGVQFEFLDVTWSRIDGFFTDLERDTITGIIGFGEGGSEVVVVERCGHNVAFGTDESDVSRDGGPIDPEGPRTNDSRIRLPADLDGVVESHNAGRYLCNYHLYHANRLDAQTSAFIHLPCQVDLPDEDYVKPLLPVVTRIVDYNFGTR